MSSAGGMAIPDAEPQPAKEKDREPKEQREKEPDFGEHSLLELWCGVFERSYI